MRRLVALGEPASSAEIAEPHGMSIACVSIGGKSEEFCQKPAEFPDLQRRKVYGSRPSRNCGSALPGRKAAQFVSNRQCRDAKPAPPMPTPTGPPARARWLMASRRTDTTPTNVALCHHDRAQVDRGQAHYPTKRTSTSSGCGGKGMSPSSVQTVGQGTELHPQD